MSFPQRVGYVLFAAFVVVGLAALFFGCSSKTEDASRNSRTGVESQDSGSAATGGQEQDGQSSGEGSRLIVHVTDGNFDAEVLESDLPVLVDFWSETCPPCRRLAPILEEVAAELEGKVKIGKLNTSENPVKTRVYGITGIPALLLFKEGKLVGTEVGFMPKEELLEFIRQRLGPN